MADVFEDHPALVDARHRLWRLVEATPWLRWLLLTKRPQNVLTLVPSAWIGADEHGMVQVDPTHRVPVRYLTPGARATLGGASWPANAWVGTTVENQRYADLRIRQLLQVPAAVRFLSVEPMLGPVELRSEWLVPSAIVCGRGPTSPESSAALAAVLRAAAEKMGGRFVDWVIAGGESGHGHRPMDEAWVRQLRNQCQASGIPFLFKQWGGRTPKAGGRELDGRTWDEVPA